MTYISVMSAIRIAGTSRPQSTNRREATEQRLLEATRKLISEQGFEQTSVTQIAREAGVTHSLINAYFGGKAGLLYAVLNDYNQAHIDRINREVVLTGSTRERIETIVGLWTDHALADRNLLSIVQAYSWQWSRETEEANRAQRRDAGRPIAAAIEAGMAQGEVRSDVDIDVALQVIVAIYISTVRQALHDDITAKECVERIMERIDLLLEGMCPAAATRPR